MKPDPLFTFEDRHRYIKSSLRQAMYVGMMLVIVPAFGLGAAVGYWIGLGK